LRHEARCASPGWADPDRDRNGCIFDSLVHISHLVTADESRLRVHLQDERLSAIGFSASDRRLDLVDNDRIEETRDLEHVDWRQKICWRSSIGCHDLCVGDFRIRRCVGVRCSTCHIGKTQQGSDRQEKGR